MVSAGGRGMTTRQQSVDQLEKAIRDYVQALMAVGPTVVTAQQNLCTAATTTSAAGRLRIG
jgi:hypothetical protein